VFPPGKAHTFKADAADSASFMAALDACKGMTVSEECKSLLRDCRAIAWTALGPISAMVVPTVKDCDHLIRIICAISDLAEKDDIKEIEQSTPKMLFSRGITVAQELQQVRELGPSASVKETAEHLLKAKQLVDAFIQMYGPDCGTVVLDAGPFKNARGCFILQMHRGIADMKAVCDNKISDLQAAVEKDIESLEEVAGGMSKKGQPLP
jgi:hypothetical protein